MSDRTIRDWEPGDGLRCRFAKRAAEGVPCGMPIKTSLLTVTGVRMAARVVRSPLCANHAAAELGGVLPGKVRFEAERRAQQRLIRDNWDAYQGYVTAEIEAIKAENLKVVALNAALRYDRMGGAS